MGCVAPSLEVEAVGAPANATLPPVCRAVGELPSPPTNLGRHAVGLPLTLARWRYDVFHAPSYVAPLWGRIPTILSIHDVSYQRRPEWYPYRRDPLRRAFYRRSAARAAAILVPSCFTADEVRAAYGIAASRIHVIPLAAAPAFHEGEPAGGPPPDSGPRYLLHVGDLHVRRDLGTAVAVLSALRAVGGTWHLVLIGSDRGVWASLSATLSHAGLQNMVTWLPQVAEAELRQWYRRSFCLLYPSHYEGFGFPLVEAMACGLPVVAARASATPEVTGEAGLLFPPGDATTAAQHVCTLATHADLWLEQQAMGRHRAGVFDWTRTAAETLSCLEAVSRSGPAAEV